MSVGQGAVEGRRYIVRTGNTVAETADGETSIQSIAIPTYRSAAWG